MKNEYYFQSVAEIQYCHWALGKLSELTKGRTPIEAMVDAATGKSLQSAKEMRKTIIMLLECIIKNSKLIGYDYSAAYQTLQDVKAVQLTTAIGIGAKPKAVRSTVAKRSGAKPGPKASPK